MVRNIAAALLLCMLAVFTPTNIRASSSYCGPDVFHPPAHYPFGPVHTRLNCRAYPLHAPKEVLLLAMAVNQTDRERGLMFVRQLPPHIGMFFAYPDGDAMRIFWMKNTLIPLDMIFIGANGTVNAVAENVPPTSPKTPDTEIPRRYGIAQFVLELNAGEAARDGIFLGTHLEIRPIHGVM